jgi:GxxExxY protein
MSEMITVMDKNDYSDKGVKNDPLTEKIIYCCFKAHKELGPGFNEKIYQNALKILFKEESLGYKSEEMFDVIFQEQKVGKLIIDLLVENKVIVELKAVTGIMPKLFEAQLISYLKVTGLEVGLLINFGNRQCKIRRLVVPVGELLNHCNQQLNHCNHYKGVKI